MTDLALRFGQQTIPIVGTMLMGRSPTCSLVFTDDSKVSRQHARVFLEGGQLVIEDLGSKNGVFLNGVRIAHRASMRVNDVLNLGNQCLEIVEMKPAPYRNTATKPEGVVFDEDDEPATETLTGAEPADWHAIEAAWQRADIDLASMLMDQAFEVTALRSMARGEIDKEDQASMCDLALRMAIETKTGRWLNRLVQVHILVSKPLPRNVTASLPSLVHKVHGLDKSLFESYFLLLRRSGTRWSAVDQQLWQALERALRMG